MGCTSSKIKNVNTQNIYNTLQPSSANINTKLNYFNGNISITYPDGGKYTGFFKNGKRHGQGTYEIKNNTYKGEWQDDMRHGMGYEEDGFNGSYNGSWKLDKKYDGKEIKYLPDNLIIEKVWEKGISTNKIIYPNEITYVGDLQDNIPHGQGILEAKNQNVIVKGIFKKNKLYFGTFENDKEKKYFVKGKLIINPIIKEENESEFSSINNH